MRRSPANTERLCALREISLADPLAAAATEPNARLAQFEKYRGVSPAQGAEPSRLSVIDLVLFTAALRLLIAAPVTTRWSFPASCSRAAAGPHCRRGAIFVTPLPAGRGETYGGFAAVVGLLSWLLIAPEVIPIAAELNVVLARGSGRVRFVRTARGGQAGAASLGTGIAT